jgi:hypothetical protein
MAVVRSRKPGPFPVTIIHPATSQPSLTAAQRLRRKTAAQHGDNVTACATRGRECDVTSGATAGTVDDVAWACQAIHEAPVLARNPGPGTVQIGRTRATGVVVIVVHGTTFSVVLQPDRPAQGQPTTAATVAFGDEIVDGVVPGWCFDDDCTVTGVEWSDMVRDVLAAVL